MRTPYRPLALIISLLLSLLLLVGVFVTQSRFRATFVAGNAFALMLPQYKTALPPIKIMPLGDSITAGVTRDDLIGTHGGYRAPLWQECQQADWNVHFVGSVSSGPHSLPEQNHEGHPGWNIDQLSNNVVSWLKLYQPQIILLHIGTNDLRSGVSVSVANARLVTLLNQITSTLPHASLLVAKLIPLDEAAGSKIVPYNQQLANTVKSMAAGGKHISVVDMYSVVPLSDLSDHVHPNADGYQRMADSWFKALTPLMSTLET